MTTNLGLKLESPFSRRLVSLEWKPYHFSSFILEHCWQEMEQNFFNKNATLFPARVKKVGIIADEELHRISNQTGYFRLYLPNLKLVPEGYSKKHDEGLDYVARTNFATGFDFAYFVLLNLIYYIHYYHIIRDVYSTAEIPDIKIRDGRLYQFVQELQDYFRPAHIWKSKVSLLPGLPHNSALHSPSCSLLFDDQHYELFIELSLLYAYYWLTNYVVAYCLNKKGVFHNQDIAKSISTKDLDSIYKINNPASWRKIEQINLKPEIYCL